MKKITLIMVWMMMSMFLAYSQNTMFKEVVPNETTKSEDLQEGGTAKGGVNVLLSESFESTPANSLPQGWSIVTVSGSAWSVGAINNGTGVIAGHSGTKYARVLSANSNSNDAWLFTAAFELQAGKSYKISFWTLLAENGGNNQEKLEVKIGTSANVAGMATQLYKKENTVQSTWTEEIAVYTPTVTGTYYLGFHCYSGQAGVTLVDDVSVYEAIKLDAGVVSLNLKQYISSENNYTISGKIRNYGLDTLTSCKINYQIDDAVVNTSNLTMRLFGDKDQTFTHPTRVTPVLGNHTIKVWTSEPNGITDMNLSNDTLIFQYAVFDADAAFPLCPLLEAFTSSTCGVCPSGSAKINGVLASNTGIYTLIKYQTDAPYPGDPYYTAEAGVKESLYAIPGVPHLVIDGTQEIGSIAFNNSMLQTEQNQHTFINISAEYKVEGQKVTAKVRVNSIASGAGNNLRLFVAIVEKRTTKNKKGNGETEFPQVMKKFMPNADGIAIGNLTQGTPIERNLEWEFKGNYRLPADARNPINHSTEHSVENFNNLEVVVWLQNMKTKEVYQSATAKLDPATGIQNHDAAANIKIYPNPAKDLVTIENTAGSTIQIFDILGQLLIEKKTNNETETINVKELTRGIYFVKVQKGKTATTQKLIKE